MSSVPYAIGLFCFFDFYFARFARIAGFIFCNDR